jgi:hypothetical protein
MTVGAQHIIVGRDAVVVKDVRSIKDFGAKGDGFTDDAAAFSAAFAVGGGIIIPAGTYCIGSALSIPSGVTLLGVARSSAILKRAFTGNLFTAFGAGSSFYNLTVDGDTATWGAGDGIQVLGGAYDQLMVNTTVKNFSEACMRFAKNGGSEFTAIGCRFQTTGTQGVQAAVCGPSTPDDNATPRKFYACSSGGCTLFDFGGCNHWWASGFYTNGLIWSNANAFDVSLTQFRCGSLGGNITVKGNSHFIMGLSAVKWVIEAESSIFHVQCPDWEIDDQGQNNSIDLPYPDIWTVDWTGSVSNPSIGNGSINSQWSRRGSWARVEVDITIGSTTDLGSGDWFFSMPRLEKTTGPVGILGVAMASDNGGAYVMQGLVRVSAVGSGKVHCFFPIPAGTYLQHYMDRAGSAFPFAWDAGSVLRFSYEYRLP